MSASAEHPRPADSEDLIPLGTDPANPCVAYGLPLATLNIKDFAEHDGLALLRP